MARTFYRTSPSAVPLHRGRCPCPPGCEGVIGKSYIPPITRIGIFRDGKHSVYPSL